MVPKSVYELEVNTWTQHVQQLVHRNLTVMAGACRVIHPGAPPKPSPGPMSVRTSLLEPHERAAERSVEAVRVLASRQLTAVWAWWDVRGRPAQGNGDRPRLPFRVFDQSLWDCAGRLRRTSLVVLAACEDLTDGFVCLCVCGACDTDKRPRRVRVTRMLPGKKDSREKTHFIVSCFPRTPILSPRDTKLSCRWGCEAFASCWTANTPTEGWTTTLELCPFDWITWRLLFKTCGQNPHLGFLLSIFVVRLMWVWGIERLRELHFRRGRAGQQWGLLLDCLPLCPIHRPCGGAVTSTEDK